jgi:AcrR family transcriptional regulator
MKDTRERILETALDLFIERGYEKTSLREIAERIGVTKPALYYHFASKEEILETLFEPIFTGQKLAAEFLSSKPSLEDWGKILASLVAWALSQRRLFELMENNRSTLQSLSQDSKHFEAHGALHRSLDEVMSDKTTPLADRIRIAGAIGLVGGALGMSGNTFADAPPEELQTLLVEAINDVLHVD